MLGPWYSQDQSQNPRQVSESNLCALTEIVLSSLLSIDGLISEKMVYYQQHRLNSNLLM